MLRTLSLLLAFSIVTPALAGELADDTNIYTSDFGYTLKLPDGWRHADSSNHKKIEDDLPEAFKKADVGVYDVLLFDAALKGDEKESLHDNINIIVVIPPVDTEEAGVDTSVADKLKPDMEALFQKVTLRKSEVSKHGDIPSVDVRWKIEDQDGAVQAELYQYILTLDKAGGTLLVTCAIGKPRALEREQLCKDLIASIKDKP